MERVLHECEYLEASSMRRDCQEMLLRRGDEMMYVHTKSTCMHLIIGTVIVFG